ncbi:winged helix-turn-helix domain-containing protein [Acetobacter thailandicus]|uniref:winged helix-turn-helix domain-containing protein n=1 Tax=Acetobacter thailandicus TaxID=1502842 RepID=UPI001BAAF06D|nr:winged helix-turn-helix domain-containing protein [Acetobacter thailandicus]MBS0981017.1 winged helix-turn-helix domain-containing protein [Acetobacter thailandicus]
MSRRRWSKFWWQDYEQDAALRLCSLAAQGLWMRLLCLMHEAEPYGHLCLNGQPLQPRQLAVMTGVAARQVVRLMAELGQAGVYSTSAEGCVFSRRLVRDQIASEQGTAWGRTGGSPGLKRSAGQARGLPPLHIPQEAEAEAETDSPFTTFGPEGDAREHLFIKGVAIVQRMTGRPERAVRVLVGRWLKVLHDDAATLSSVLCECSRFRPAEPVAWIEGALRRRLESTVYQGAARSVTGRQPHAVRMDAWRNVPDMEGI